MSDQQFSDDSPKANPWQEDRLGYAPFAARLSKLILRLNAPSGFVIGVHGAWGSGKSTLLNFVQAYIKKHNDELPEGVPRLEVIDYRPWIISGHQNVVSGFFKVLTEKIGGRKGWWTRWKYRLARLFGGAADPLIDTAAAVGFFVDPTAGAASAAGGALAKKGARALVDGWLAEPSLQSAYDALNAQLAKELRRFLVIIDDIDRLDGDEIRTMLQMVKSVGRLPNVIYLLAYDRRIVWDAVDGGRPLDPWQPSYAEKIVQQELELPRPSHSSLMKLLDEELTFFFVHGESTLRWHYIVERGVRRWMRYPRDVFRLANAVKFAWPALEGELDPQDLLAMEGLRLFDPDVFDWIRRNRDYLMATGRYSIVSDSERAGAATAFRESLSAEVRDDVLQLLAHLFPARGEELTGERFVFGEPHYQQVNRAGVCTEAGYDTYFSLYPSPNHVPRHILDAAVRQLDDEAAQVELIRHMLARRTEGGEGLVAEYLAELGYRFIGPHAPQPTVALLNALFVTGAELFAAGNEVRRSSFGAYSQFHLLTVDIIERLGKKAAGKALLDACSKASIEVAASVFVSRAQELGVIPGRDREPRELVTKADLKRLGVRLLRRIRTGHADGSLEKASSFFDIAVAWADLENPEAPRAWISEGSLRSPQFLAKVTKGFLAYSMEGRRVYFLRSIPDRSLYDYPVLYSAAQSHLSARDLTQDERDRIAALAKGVQE
ncbi:MAG TPA: P-loop NTPase fold protein [Caulobacteraceae bacterium]